MIEVSSSHQAFEVLKENENPFAEELWIIALNAQMKMLHKEMIFRGTADHCLIHPRDIFRILIMCNASSFIMAHNHPSQDVTPSDQDLTLTYKIFQLATMLQIPMQDHLVFTSLKYFSMADHGYFKKWRRNKKKFEIYLTE